MNSKIVISSAVCVATLMIGTTAIAQHSVQVNQSSTSVKQQGTTSVQAQTTVISLDADQLRFPHVLTVSTSANTKLTGRIVVNGKTIEQFREQGVSIDLSPYLGRGRQTVEVLGNYTPAQSSIRVNLSAPGTQVSQQTGGNGILQQTLVIDVL